MAHSGIGLLYIFERRPQASRAHGNLTLLPLSTGLQEIAAYTPLRTVDVAYVDVSGGKTQKQIDDLKTSLRRSQM